MTGPQYYRDVRAGGLTTYFILADRARMIFDRERTAQNPYLAGTLEDGFSYWVSSGAIRRLVHVSVTPVAAHDVPDEAKQALADGADQAW